MSSLKPTHPVELISAHIDGELKPGEIRYLEAHLALCPDCRQKEAELRRIAARIGAVPMAAPPPEAFERLLARLAEPSPTIVADSAIEPPVEPVPPPWMAVFTTAAAPRPEALERLLARLAETPTMVAGSPIEPDVEPVATIARPARRTPWVAVSTTAAALTVALLAYGWGMGMNRGPVPALTPAPTPGAGSPFSVAGPPAPAPAACQSESGNTCTLASLSPEPPPTRRPAVEVVAPPPAARTAALEPAPSTRLQLEPIHFKGNSKRLTRDARKMVETVARFLREHRDVALVIEGHAGPRHSPEKQQALAHKRALAVARHLERLGIDAPRLRAVASATHTEDGRDRVEFALAR